MIFLHQIYKCMWAKKNIIRSSKDVNVFLMSHHKQSHSAETEPALHTVRGSQSGICILPVESEEATVNWILEVFDSSDMAQEVPVSVSGSAGGEVSGGGQWDKKGKINDAFVGRACTGCSIGRGAVKLLWKQGWCDCRLVEGRQWRQWVQWSNLEDSR